MRTSVASFALFRRAAPFGRVEYLAQWNEGWRAYHFVGGHKHDGESFRDCCVREVGEELGLAEGHDFRLAPERRCRLQYVHFSERAGVETDYTVELFDAELLGDAARAVEADPDNRWLTDSDVRAGRCRDGRAVSPTMLRILSLAGLTPDEFDVFVSYAHKDDAGGWVSALLDAVRAEHHQFTNVPLRIFFDREAIRDMQDWEHRILSGLRSARVMLAVLSPDYVASAFCRREWQTFVDHELGRTPPGESIAPLYTVTVPGFEDGEAAGRDAMLKDLGRRQWLDVRPWWTAGAAALRREDVRARLKLLDAEIDDKLRRAGQAAASPAVNLPAHNRNFVGRRDELRRLREVLACGRVGAVAAVQGLGGVGKTALAREYAHAFAEHYPGGRYVLRAEGAADFRAAVVDQLRPALGVELNDDEKKSYDLSFPRVWATLQGWGRSLLVLDNLDGADVLAEATRRGVLPAGDAVHVLATTRLEPADLEDGQHVQCLLLDALPAEDGLELLKRFREPAGDAEWKAALALVNRLGGHALALEVVGVFLWKNPDVAYADYLARLEAEGAGAVEGAAKDAKVKLSRHPEKFIGRLLEPTLSGLTPLELRAVEYAARLPPDAVPLPWLEALLRGDRAEPMTKRPLIRWFSWVWKRRRWYAAEAMTKRPGYPDPWQQVVRRLDGLRLLVYDRAEPRLARMHRVVRDVVVARMGAAAAAERRRTATEHALERAKFLWDGWVDRAVRWEIEPIHLFAWELMDAGDVAGAHLADSVQEPLGQLGRMTERRALLQKGIIVQERAYDPGHPRLAVSYSNLATVERVLGNLAEARELLRKAVAIEERAYDPGHPALAVRYSNLALVERDLGNLAEARELLRKAVAIEERAYDPGHPRLAVSYSNLALVERDLGNLAEARELLRKALAIGERAHDPGHPSLAVIYSNLATVERSLGNLPEARELLRKALAIDERAFDPGHPNLALSYSNLATVKGDGLGNLPEARELLRKAIAIWERAFDPSHPTLAVSYSNLAMVEMHLGNLPEARELLHKAIAIDEHLFDPGHPTLAVRYSNLATVEYELGNLPEARELLRKAIAIEERAFHAAHPKLAVRYSNLATVKQGLGNLPEARELLRKAIAIEERAFEPGHPNLAVRYSNLAMVEMDLGNLPEARELLRKAIAIQQRAFDPRHPTLAVSYWNLSQVEYQLGNHTEAIDLARRAYRIRTDKLGEQHRDTQMVRTWLAAHDPEFPSASDA